MIVRILLIDDQPENVAALRAELVENLPGCICDVIGFQDANERIESHDPHVVVLDASGAPVYNSSGEVEERVISGFLDKALR